MPAEFAGVWLVVPAEFAGVWLVVPAEFAGMWLVVPERALIVDGEHMYQHADRRRPTMSWKRAPVAHNFAYCWGSHCSGGKKG